MTFYVCLKCNNHTKCKWPINNLGKSNMEELFETAHSSEVYERPIVPRSIELNVVDPEGVNEVFKEISKIAMMTPLSNEELVESIRYYQEKLGVSFSEAVQIIRLMYTGEIGHLKTKKEE